ncbi:hypothetical protein QUF90_09820 [Desulfococcaceae bacterium HSG9]|nr:hypothetical protein [Desulfococcaceae bacterium HSG9]
MPKTWLVILLHQLIFQGMFVMKNIILHRKIGKQIRGKNIEATVSINDNEGREIFVFCAW